MKRIQSGLMMLLVILLGCTSKANETKEPVKESEEKNEVTEEEDTENNETVEIPDVDYKEVEINGQVWMAENLDVHYFKNGDVIPESKSLEEFKEATDNQKPTWIYYNNDPENGEKYGKLYNFYAVTDERGLAPEGWRIPLDKDFQQLIETFEYRYKAQNHLRSEDGWADMENDDDTNSSGFNGLPAGALHGWMDNTRKFGGEGEFAGWWSGDLEFNPKNMTTNLGLYIGEMPVTTDSAEDMGLSVRCIKE